MLSILLLGLGLGLTLAAGRFALQDAHVAGTLHDALTGKPLPVAQVWLKSEVMQVEGGTFHLSLPPGKWSLRAQAPGYGEREIALDTRPAHPRAFLIQLDLPPQELELQVRDGQTGLAVPQAVAVAGGEPCFTDAQGRCRWLRLHGEVVVEVWAEGYLPQQVALTPDETLSHQTQRNPLLVHLLPACLKVQVTDKAGQPVSGAEVMAGSRRLWTDAGGRLALCHVPGSLEVRVWAEGYDPWQGQSLAGLEGDHPPLYVVLTPRQVPGTVLADDTEEPIPGARVRVGSGQEAQTGLDGGFLLEGLSRRAEGTVEAEGYVPQAWQYLGQDRLELRLTPVPTAVEVRDLLSGQPLAGAWGGVGKQWAQADRFGVADLVRLHPGDEVQATAPGHLAGHLTYAGGSTVTVPLLASALKGVVRDASTGHPVPHAWLYTPVGLLQTDAEGRYRLEGYSSPPEVRVKAAGYRRLHVLVDPATLADQAHRPAADLAREGGLALRPAEQGRGMDLDFLLVPHEVRALYISLGRLSEPVSVWALLKLAAESDLNGVVIDVKGDKGRLAFPPSNRTAREAGAFRTDLMDLKEVLAFCQEHNLYTIARLVVFKDPVLAAARPEWALHRSDGTLWQDHGGAAWVNPYLQEVWEYNFSLAREVADLGFDEVQLDYLRFPSDGAVGEIDYGQESTRKTRMAAIREFSAAFASAMRDKVVFTAADVFGLTVTVHPESDMGIGQRVADIAPFVDYLCPMVYPSTFTPGNLGLENPYASPYEVVYRSVQEAVRRVPVTTRVRPWLQYYSYGLDDLLEQKKAARDAGGFGWMFWNGQGNYLFPQVFDEPPMAPGLGP